MKKTLVLMSLLLVAALLLSLAGCTSSSSGTTDKQPTQTSTPGTSESSDNAPIETKDKKIVIGCSLVSKDNQWWANVGKYMEEYGLSQGYEMIILWANADQEKQIKDVEDLVQ